jgi:hypothetical protein
LQKSLSASSASLIIQPPGTEARTTIAMAQTHGLLHSPLEDPFEDSFEDSFEDAIRLGDPTLADDPRGLRVSHTGAPGR